MNAGQVAEFPDVDLKDLRLRVAERQGMLGQLSREGVVSSEVHRFLRSA
jgi:hypothetical protein